MIRESADVLRRRYILIVPNISAAARHALARLPDPLHKLAVSVSLFSLLKAVYSRQHEAVYTGAEELLNLCHQPALSNGKLGVVLAGLTTAFIGERDSASDRTVSPVVIRGVQAQDVRALGQGLHLHI